MTQCSSIINTVLEHFKKDARLVGVSFVKEFPNSKCNQPMRSPVVSVGVDRLVVENKEGVLLGEGTSPCVVDLKVMICVPTAGGGNSLYEVLDKIMVSLIGLVGNLGIRSILTEDAQYSSTINGLVVPMKISINAGQMC